MQAETISTLNCVLVYYRSLYVFDLLASGVILCGCTYKEFDLFLCASDQATDPNNQEDRWDCIQAFYQLVNKESEG